MTHADDAAPDGPDDTTARALAQVLPGLRRIQWRGRLRLAVSVIAALALGVGLIWLGGQATAYGIAVLIAILILPLANAGLTRKAVETEVMPIVAEAFDLDYAKSPPDFFDRLPNRLVPFTRTKRRSCDDDIQGLVAGRPFRLTEMQTVTSTANTQRLFRGIILSIGGAQALPDFLIAGQRESRGFRPVTTGTLFEGMELAETIPAARKRGHGLWLPEGAAGAGAAFRPFMERMIAIGADFAPGATLYSVLGSGTTLHVAISYDPNLFGIGGLWAGQARILEDVRRTAAEFAAVFALVGEIVRAEALIPMAGQEPAKGQSGD